MNALPGLIEALMAPLLIIAMLQLAQVVESGYFRFVWTAASAIMLPGKQIILFEPTFLFLAILSCAKFK